MPIELTQFQVRWLQLSAAQKDWVRNTANQRDMTVLNVMLTFNIPEPGELNEDGTLRERTP